MLKGQWCEQQRAAVYSVWENETLGFWIETAEVWKAWMHVNDNKLARHHAEANVMYNTIQLV